MSFHGRIESVSTRTVSAPGHERSNGKLQVRNNERAQMTRLAEAAKRSIDPINLRLGQHLQLLVNSIMADPPLILVLRKADIIALRGGKVTSASGYEFGAAYSDSAHVIIICASMMNDQRLTFSAVAHELRHCFVSAVKINPLDPNNRSDRQYILEKYKDRINPEFLDTIISHVNAVYGHETIEGRKEEIDAHIIGEIAFNLFPDFSRTGPQEQQQALWQLFIALQGGLTPAGKAA